MQEIDTEVVWLHRAAENTVTIKSMFLTIHLLIVYYIVRNPPNARLYATHDAKIQDLTQ